VAGTTYKELVRRLSRVEQALAPAPVTQHQVFLQAVGISGKPSGPVLRLTPDGHEEHSGALEGAIELVPHGPARTWQEYW
jgi:hypothetical protein